MADDVFTQTYNYIFDTLKEDYDLLQVIPERNFIDLTSGDRDPFNKGTIDPADFPAFRMLPTGGEINLKATSSSANVEQLFELQVATADMRLSNSDEEQTLYFPLKWLILKALYPCVGGHEFTANAYGNEFTLVGLDVESNDEGFEDDERGQKGWFSVIDIRAVLNIPRTTLEG